MYAHKYFNFVLDKPIFSVYSQYHKPNFSVCTGDKTMRQTLIELRQSKNMTQAELGELINLSQQAISDIESGRVVGKVEVWRQLAFFFNTTIEAISQNDSASKELRS
jgi:DNA-binding XRE family transcriptional regulator